MRSINVISMITLDRVLQAPGAPEEDTSGGFLYGGWTSPYSDDEFLSDLQKDLQPSDYLLGRNTFEIWEAYWPHHGDFWPAINEGAKFVMSTTRDQSNWKDTVFLNSLSDIKKLKHSNGPDLQVWGSGRLIQLLMEHDLVDSLTLKIYPVTLGQGKKLFEEGTMPAAFTLTESMITPRGVIIARYKRAGDVQTGSVEV